ncbi:MAG: hypothetical protein E6J23_07335 [Chloroflexi bacterium]|nr:MAG: hypothetical protein E6J23_07335 [Chloroflexota bacterium]
MTGVAPAAWPELPIPSHASLLAWGTDEIRDVSLSFITQGLDHPDEALFCFGRPGIGELLLRDLERRTGRDLSSDHREGRIVLGKSDPDVDRQLENVVGPLETFREKGFRVVRFIGIVAWNAPDFPPPEDFLWFESKVTEVLEGSRVICLCPYDIANMPARAIAYGALEAHPFVLSGGKLRANPLFIPPDRYLRDRLLDLPRLEAAPDR